LIAITNGQKKVVDSQIYLVHSHPCKNPILSRKPSDISIYDNNNDIEDITPKNSVKYLLLKAQNIVNQKIIFIDIDNVFQIKQPDSNGVLII